MDATITDNLAAALRRMIDTDTGGKYYSGQQVHDDAIRDGIVALAAYDAANTLTLDCAQPFDTTNTFDGAAP